MKKLLIYIMLSGGALTASGQTNIYDELLQSVKDNNPELKALRAENEAAILEMGKENLLEDPEIEFGYLWGTNNPERKWDLGVSQTFDFPTLYQARKKALAARRATLELAYKVALIDKQLEVKTILVELAYLEKASRIQAEVVENLAEVVTFLQRAYDNGEVTILDVNKAKVECANATISLTELKSKQNESAEALTVAIGRIVDVGIIDNVDYPVGVLHGEDFYARQALENPVVEVYNSMAREAVLNRKIAGMGYLPRITVGYQHEREGSESFDGFKIGLTLPVFSNRRSSRVVTEQALATGFEMQARQSELTASVAGDYKSATQLKATMEMLAPVFNQTNHPALLLKAFKGGELTAMEYLNELNYFRTAEQDFLATERDYHLTLARLNRFQGL